METLLSPAAAVRMLTLLAVLILGACSSMTFTAVEATRFRNAETGEVVAACGPMQGMAGPLQKAQQGCIDSYKGKGWTPFNG